MSRTKSTLCLCVQLNETCTSTNGGPFHLVREISVVERHVTQNCGNREGCLYLIKPEDSKPGRGFVCIRPAYNTGFLETPVEQRIIFLSNTDHTVF